ncbi:MAG: RNA polymerase sigma factor [Bacteroidales bacterium]|jgi:RNA polymerase sigma-70 factor (ECF subfamily)|nr:RNA polymerase sigma factor [Bacteroidales bacterium]
MMNENDYNRLVMQHSDGIFRFLARICGDRAKAKDLTQDVFLKLWECRMNIDDNKTRAWLFKTAHNAFIDNERHNKIMIKDNDYLDLQCQKVQNGYSDLKEVLSNALSALPEMQKSAILLRDYEGYSYDEIGKILSLSAQQVKVYIFRARTSLKQMIGKIENVI